MRITTELEVAWLAGIIEGEGSIGIIKNHVSGRIYLYPKIVVTMTDVDVIQRVANIWERSVSIIQPAGVSVKIGYRTYVSGRYAERWINILYPYMGERRKKRMEETLIVIKDQKIMLGDANQRRSDSMIRSWKDKRENISKVTPSYDINFPPSFGKYFSKQAEIKL